MLQLRNISIGVKNKTNEYIITNLNFTFEPSKIYFLIGDNGSGKSTLVNTLMGHPQYSILSGEIFLSNSYEQFQKINELKKELDENEINFDDYIKIHSNDNITLNELPINKLSAFIKSHLGLFLVNQYPVEIPGLNMMSYLRQIYNARQDKSRQLSVFKFKNYLNELAKEIKYPLELLKRNLNEGFSGGEKKKTEILQMILLKPKYIFIDEVDSGLDKNSRKIIFESIKKYYETNPDTTLLIISHYEYAFDLFPIHTKIFIEQGKIVCVE